MKKVLKKVAQKRKKKKEGLLLTFSFSFLVYFVRKTFYTKEDKFHFFSEIELFYDDYDVLSLCSSCFI